MRGISMNIYFARPKATLPEEVEERLSTPRPRVTLRDILIKLISASERRGDFIYDRQMAASASRAYFHDELESEDLHRRICLRQKIQIKLERAESRREEIHSLRAFRARSQNLLKSLIASQATRGKEYRLKVVKNKTHSKGIRASLRRDTLRLRKQLAAREEFHHSVLVGKLNKDLKKAKRYNLVCRIIRKHHRAAEIRRSVR